MRKVGHVLVAGGVGLCLVVTLGWGNIAGAASISLKAEHDEPMGSITDTVLKEAAKEVESRSQGQIKMTVHPACSLSGGNIKTMVANTQMGSVDLAIIATSVYAPIMDTRLNVFQLPFIVNGIDQLEQLGRKSMLAKRLYKEQGVKNLETVDAWSRNLRQFVNRRRPIKTPEDMSGLSFRVPETELWQDAIKALGANAISMPFSEIQVALQAGAIDGAERPTEFIMTEEWWTMAKFVTMSNYTGDMLMVSFNNSKWKSIPSNLQAILIESLLKAGDRKLKDEKAFQEKAIQTLAGKGMTVTVLNKDEQDKFRDKMDKVWQKHSAKIGKEIVEEAMSVVKK